MISLSLATNRPLPHRQVKQAHLMIPDKTQMLHSIKQTAASLLSKALTASLMGRIAVLQPKQAERVKMEQNYSLVLKRSQGTAPTMMAGLHILHLLLSKLTSGKPCVSPLTSGKLCVHQC